MPSLCSAGKHEKTPENTGDDGRCIECKREYQREYMRRKRQSEQLDGMTPAAMRAALDEAQSR